MITAEDVYKQSILNPTDFGKGIIPTSVTGPEDQMELAITHIENFILPGAISNVAVPFMRSAAGNSLPLPDSIILRKYPLMDSTARTALNQQLEDLYDSAVLSFARSEVNKQVFSSTKSYDDDADQDRIMGNQKLQRLLDMMNEIITGKPQPRSEAPTNVEGRLSSQSISHTISF